MLILHVLTILALLGWATVANVINMVEIIICKYTYNIFREQYFRTV